MFLYYLVDLRHSQPHILNLYRAEQSHLSKEDMIKKYLTQDFTDTDYYKIVYSRVLLTDICGGEQISPISPLPATGGHPHSPLSAKLSVSAGLKDVFSKELNVYFFYVGHYEFYCSIGNTLEDALVCLHTNVNQNKWKMIEEIVKKGQYDSFPLDKMIV